MHVPMQCGDDVRACVRDEKKIGRRNGEQEAQRKYDAGERWPPTAERALTRKSDAFAWVKQNEATDTT